MEIKPLSLCIPGIPYMVMVFPNDCSNFEIMKIAINVGNLSNTINVGDLSNKKEARVILPTTYATIILKF